MCGCCIVVEWELPNTDIAVAATHSQVVAAGIEGYG